MIKQNSVHWILNDSVCIVDGFGWGVAPNLRTVCLGREEDILKGDKK